MAPELQKAFQFIESIGLSIKLQPGANGFVEGVRIEAGSLVVDPQCRASTLLHEAGHLACVPAQFRSYMDANLCAGMKRMFGELDQMNLDPDHPLVRAAIQCSDPEATAWAWAAGVAIGLVPEQIIRDDEYDGAGAEIRAQVQASQYLGINGLAHAGMCKRGFGVAPEFRYPKMTTWLQAA